MTNAIITPVDPLETPTPQTVNFTLRVSYRHIDRLGTGLADSIDYDFDDFDTMYNFIRKERRRRAYRDRATYAEYRMNLTDAGRVAISKCAYTKNSHRDAIAGTWFPNFPFGNKHGY